MFARGELSGAAIRACLHTGELSGVAHLPMFAGGELQTADELAHKLSYAWKERNRCFGVSRSESAFLFFLQASCDFILQYLYCNTAIINTTSLDQAQIFVAKKKRKLQYHFGHKK